ncbi:hypothetical protein NY2A_B285L [Paramecium bursaria Chlorella virus NY2A]|uniref:Uncharacterized protein B285L n=1 Tax=Paramecium bursaria Chlorella virus NY2A TaxID=46021 RepID=A7IWG0_PBCVN|nr:hypothetical protein NY2A_B285L [Paramecium bursaria Chlorella virus NY2A]ABT14684.1 hypothetical protein NY2A_B285L [Paramecium bursaria Chlorella virus NY2A]
MEFISAIERFVELHQNILNANQALKDAKKEKAILYKQILEYMTSHAIQSHTHDGFDIIAKESEIKGKIDLEMIEHMMENMIGETVSQEHVEKMITSLADNLSSGDIKTTLSIKKIKGPKKSRSKKSKKNEETD